MQNKPREESPVEVKMDEWDRKLRAESGKIQHNQRRFRPVAPSTPPDPLDELAQLLGSGPMLRQVKFEIARLVLSKSGGHVPDHLPDDMVNRIVCQLASELATRQPTPADGRATIDAELYWSSSRDVPLGTDTSRPCAPVEEAPLASYTTSQRRQQDPIRPRPTASAGPRGGFSVRLRQAPLVAPKKNSSTVTRSVSSAFSECSTGSFGSLTRSSVSGSTGM